MDDYRLMIIKVDLLRGEAALQCQQIVGRKGIGFTVHPKIAPLMLVFHARNHSPSQTRGQRLRAGLPAPARRLERAREGL